MLDASKPRIANVAESAEVRHNGKKIQTRDQRFYAPTSLPLRTDNPGEGCEVNRAVLASLIFRSSDLNGVGVQ